MLKIWGRNSSMNVQKVLWVCAELDIPFERIDLGGPFGGNDKPEYLVLNPSGRVPTIEDGKTILWESNTIIRYLCTTRGGAQLYPVDPVHRAQVERWMDWQLSMINNSMAALIFGYYRTPPERRDLAALEAARLEALHYWRIIDGYLDGRTYLECDRLTLADIPVGIWAYRWYRYPIERPELPNLRAWYERLAERPAYKAHIAIPIS